MGKIFLIMFLFIVTGCGEKELLFTKDEIVKGKGDHSEKVETHRIKYMSGDLEVGGFLVVPKNRKKKYPVIIYNRGGNRNFGLLDRRMDYLEYLASRGYVVAASQYRGNLYSEGRDEYGGQDVDDILNLIAKVKKLSYVDRENIFMIGFSRGGAMTYIADRRGADIRAMAVIAGVTDLFQSYNERDEAMKKTLRSTVGGTPDETPDEYRKRSAVYWFHEIRSPVIIFHGREDKRVMYEQGLRMAEGLEINGKEYKFISYDDTGHNMGNNKDNVNELIFEWFEKHMK